MGNKWDIEYSITSRPVPQGYKKKNKLHKGGKKPNKQTFQHFQIYSIWNMEDYFWVAKHVIYHTQIELMGISEDALLKILFKRKCDKKKIKDWKLVTNYQKNKAFPQSIISLNN